MDMHTYAPVCHRAARVKHARPRPLLSLGLITTLLASFVVGQPTPGQAATPPLTAPTVVSALRRAGLPVAHVYRQPVGGDPSGPPPTERESWGFTLGHAAREDARLLLFSTARRRDLKGAWYRRVGARIIMYRNAILWFDRGLAPAVVARCRRALEGIR